MTQNFDVFAKRKGQSAIEYLMTYGWMLLVVAIVGGAIFATVQGQCTTSTSGFSTADVRIADFGVNTDGDMSFDLRNGAADPIEVNNIEVGGVNDSEFANTNIPVGDSGVFTVEGTNAESVDGCNDFDVTIEYNITDGIDNQQATGTLTDSISIN